VSNFGGPGWTRVGSQYYYHSFLAQQPDVNWRNPDLRAAMLGVLRFWLERGVDGFRVDVMWMMIKDDQFRDNPASGFPLYNTNRPEVHAIVAEMRAVLDSFGDRLLIGEVYLPFDQLATYYGVDLNGAHLPFNFHLMQSAWNAEAIAKVITDYEAALPRGAWPNWVVGNHDQPRIATRVGSGLARIAAMLLLTLRGTPTMYYGEEIGMTDVPIPAAEIQDPAEKNQPGKGQGRDPERTPMQWDGSPSAGFTTGKPWLRLSADYEQVNVATLSQAADSMLNLYRGLISLRSTNAALHSGGVEAVAAGNNVLRYERVEDNQRFAVVLNFSGVGATIQVPAGQPVLSTHMDQPSDATLRPYEGRIYKL
jgi:alpha-glucosidase